MKTYNLREDPSGVPFDVQVPTDTDDLANKSTVNGGAGNLTQALDSLNGAMGTRTWLTWGDTNVAATTNTRYLSPGYSDGTAQTDPPAFRAPGPGTAKSLRIHARVGAGNGEPIVYTLRVNGNPTALTVSMASTDVDGADLVNMVAIAAGDLIDIEVTKANGIAASPTDILASLEIAA